MVTLAQIENAHPESVREIARSWKRTAAKMALAAENYEQTMINPGGQPWEGVTANAAKGVARSDHTAVNNLRSAIDTMADRTITAIDEVVIQRLTAVRSLIETARNEGFDVHDDLSLTFPDSDPPDVAKKERGEKLAGDIGTAARSWWQSEALVT